MISLLGRFREKYESALQPIGVALGRLGATPNSLTTLSLLVSAVASVAYGLKSPLLGGFGLAISGLIDMLDGAVARATGGATRFGAVYDHVLDRYAEFAILFGIGIGGLVGWEWIVFCLFGMVMASFTRAKAESVGGLRSCTVGLAERQEKIILLLVGSFVQPFISFGLLAALATVAVLSHITVLQRLYYTFKHA